LDEEGVEGGEGDVSISVVTIRTVLGGLRSSMFG
jgi:hypothetical protein